MGIPEFTGLANRGETIYGLIVPGRAIRRVENLFQVHPWPISVVRQHMNP